MRRSMRLLVRRRKSLAIPWHAPINKFSNVSALVYLVYNATIL